MSKPKKKGRAIRDTDIVYSAMMPFDTGERAEFGVRLSLDPNSLDNEGFCSGPQFPGRAVYARTYGSDTPEFFASCRSRGFRDTYRPYWREHDDSWLDWLAEGEPGRGGT